MSTTEDRSLWGENPPQLSETNVTSSRTRRRKTKARSEIWDHFERVEEDGCVRGRCKYCKRLLPSNIKKNGTQSLWSHLHTCDDHPHNQETHRNLLSLQASVRRGEIQSERAGNSSSGRYDEVAIRDAICKMIIIDELPFKFVEGAGFRLLMSVICPRFVLPTRWTFSRDCYQLYLDEKKSLRDFLRSSSQMVCLTTDTWSSIQRISYMCLTVHWIDNDWKLNKRILNFCTISSHKGEELAWAVEGCLREWGIERVFSVTVDNASSNNVMMTHLKRILISRHACVAQGKFLHMRCAAHILNLVVQDGLKEIDQAVLRVRDATRYVRQSPNRLQKFKQCVEMEGIKSLKGVCVDVQSRWNSTYLMLKNASMFEKAFDRLAVLDSSFKAELLSSDAKGVPEEHDWKRVGNLITLLEVFYDTTLHVSGSLYVTSNMYIHEISNIYARLYEFQYGDEATKNPNLRHIASKMQVKYDKYWRNNYNINLMIFIPVVLDPRWKIGFLKYVVEEMFGEHASGLVSKVQGALIDLFVEYETMYNKPDESATSSTPSPIVLENENMSKGYLMASRYKKMKSTKSKKSRSELDRYLDEENEEQRKDFDILLYWKINSGRFPILSKLVRDVLAIPISTVASESAFSTGGRVLDPFRSSLTPALVQSLVCAADWLRASIGSTRMSVEEELADIEKLEEELDSVPLVEPTFSQI